MLATAQGARADEGTTSALSWVRLPGAEPCLSTTELSERVEKHLGRAVFVSPSKADVSIEARAERREREGTFHVVVGGTRRDGTPIGTRELDSETNDCRSLDDSLVLVVALMIDPNAMTPAPSTPAPPTRVEHTEREIIRERIIMMPFATPPSPPPASSPPRPWTMDARVDGVVAFKRLAGIAPGAAIAFGVTPPGFFPIELSLRTIPNDTLDVANARIDYWLLEGGLDLCPKMSLGRRFDFGGCAGVRIGNLRSNGTGFGRDTSADRATVDVDGSLRLGFNFAGPVFALASVAAVVPTIRQRTTITDASGALRVLDERPAIGAETTLGLGVHFSP